MKQDKNNQWLEALLAQHLGRQPAKFDIEQWAESHPNEARLLREGYGDSRANSRTKIQNVWRFIMESKVTRYSAAAVAALAVALVLIGPFGSPGNSGVVLAQVQQNVAGIETMIIRGTKTFTHRGQPDSVFEFDGIKCSFDLLKYQSTRYGLVEEGYAEGKLFYQITLNIPEGQTLIQFPKYKKYLKFASMGAFAKVMENFSTPGGIVKLLLAGDCKKLGPGQIDGVEVEAFEFQDSKPLEPIKELLPKVVFDIQSFKGKVWIAVKEQLPVRVEGDLAIGKSFMTMFQELNLHEVNTFGQYNIELDENIFAVDPPEGYTEVTLVDMLRLVPMEAKAGLAGLGLAPVGFIVWKRRRNKRTAAHLR